MGLKRDIVQPELANGDVLFLASVDEHHQLFRNRNGKRKQLTSFVSGANYVVSSPDSTRTLIVANSGPNDSKDLFLYDHSKEQLTKLPIASDCDFRYPLWISDSKQFLFRARTSQQSVGIHLFDTSTNKQTQLYEGISPRPACLDRSGAQVAIEDRSNLIVINLKGKVLSTSSRKLLKGWYWALALLGDGKVLGEYRATKDDGTDGFVRLTLGPTQNPEWLATNLRLSRKRGVRSVHSHEYGLIAGLEFSGGTRILSVWSSTDGSKRPALTMPPGVFFPAQFFNSKMYFRFSNFTTPNGQYEWDPRTSSSPRLVQSPAHKKLDFSTYKPPLPLTYPSSDGLPIPAYLYLPPFRRDDGRLPFVVHLHGGPDVQFLPSFDRDILFLLSQGIGVLAPNYRGSRGYGRAFEDADNLELRDKAVADIQSGVAWLIKEGYTTHDRIALIGGSYGGYLALRTMAKTPQPFAAAVLRSPITDLVGYIENTPNRWRAAREKEFGALSKPDQLRELSPIHGPLTLDLPLLVAHGDADDIVPVVQSERLVAKLGDYDAGLEYLVFQGEGHSIKGMTNLLRLNEQQTKLLEQAFFNK